ncbi:adhesion G-protein coupled receptor G2, partial [Octopus bimaculoides]|uniref:adhesion G-protein coupled receptor G2 n=1 Tax=Octopus bimaculoides TaxID=37653 RepID=UPI0022E39CA1
AVAALLHYFLLTSLMWMTVEALHIYLGVVVVFKTHQPPFMKRSSIVAWGMYNGFLSFCWLSRSYFYAAFLAPVAIILTFNLIMFSLVICHLISMQHNERFEHKTRKIRVFGIAGLFFLLGLSWVLAFLAFGEAAKVFQFLFVTFNTLQGMFIFLFYCLFKEDARDVICLFVC